VAPTAPIPASPSVAPAPTAVYPLTVTGDDGVAVTLPAAPTRIVSLMPGETEILFGLGLGPNVVGKVDDPADYPPEARSVPKVASYTGVDVEKIVGLRPDLVIVGGNGGTPQEAIDKLRSLKLPVLAVYAESVDGVLADIDLTGQAAGAAAAAKDLTASMRAGFDQIAATTRDLPKPRVFYETGNEPALYGVADKSFVASMLELAGATPITTGSTTVWEEPVEKVIAADPQVILLGDAAYGVTVAEVAKRPGWGTITAVRSGAIKPVDDIVITRPGPRLVDGLRDLVEAIHPDAVLASPSPAAPAPSASAAPSASGS
jgi:iron complex transport system substrate-binding protein